MHRISILLLLLLHLACASTRTPLRETRQHAETVAASLLAEGFTGGFHRVRENRILATGFISGHRADFLVDTGASSLFLAREDSARYGLLTPSQARRQLPYIRAFLGSTNDSQSRFIRELYVAGLKLSPWPAVLLDQKTPWAVLGVELLHFCSAVLLPRYGGLFLHPSRRAAAGLDSLLTGLGYTSIPLISSRRTIRLRTAGTRPVEEGGILCIRVHIDGIEGLLGIDTGAPWAALSDDFLEAASRREVIRLRAGDAVGNRAQARGVLVDSMMVGRYALARTHGVAAFERLGPADMQVDGEFLAGVLGFDLLAMNNAVIDFGNRRMYVRP